MTKKLSSTSRNSTGVKSDQEAKKKGKKLKTTSKKSTTTGGRGKKALTSDSIYNLDTWKWNYEDVTKPKNKVFVSLTRRVKHAWEVLRG